MFFKSNSGSEGTCILETARGAGMIWKKEYDFFFIGIFFELAAQAIGNYFNPGFSISAITPMDVVFYMMMAVAFYVHSKNFGSQGEAQ